MQLTVNLRDSELKYFYYNFLVPHAHYLDIISQSELARMPLVLKTTYIFEIDVG